MGLLAFEMYDGLEDLHWVVQHTGRGNKGSLLSLSELSFEPSARENLCPRLHLRLQTGCALTLVLTLSCLLKNPAPKHEMFFLIRVIREDVFFFSGGS